MIDDFSKSLWELGENSPELQKAIAKSLTSGEYYSIPTRQYCEATGEVEDIHTLALVDAKTESQREAVVTNLKKIDNMTIKELAEVLSYVRVAYLVKEAEGKKVEEPEKTLRDIDITLLAFYAVNVAPKVIGRTAPIKAEDNT